ncbi:L-threonylcarbamoyladenylate synthase [Anaeromusa sp.]|uniref:L-threonylcarbamoyladenylate synthase n=1 Tax=Anaeromusa sp. TaxID=1872520 RepID=UPI002604C237|nr:L-threonylcarbamoyladenylate synthase [Anaeromusa sp.]MDD3157703.1 L-threonylcarbamoyladenylate synthase [Anaeromusa sp.]
MDTLKKETLWWRVDAKKPDLKIIAAAAQLLREGKLVAFPTETVYGLGANGLDAEASASIYRAKGRPSDNPLILHVADLEAWEPLVQQITPLARKLAERFWPGPLTMILPRSFRVPDVVTGGLDTVAVRMPATAVTRELIRQAGVPMAGPSANTSGKPSPTTAEAVWEDLHGRIDAILDCGPCAVGLESTVVDLSGEVPMLLRPGGLTVEALREVIPNLQLDPALAGAKVAIPKAPGMKYRHYAPKAAVEVWEGPADLVAQAFLEAWQQDTAEETGFLVTEELAERLPASSRVITYGQRRRPQTLAAGLFAALRRFDALPVRSILAEGVEEAGLGQAVMNRLRKAAGQRVRRFAKGE